MNEDNNTDNVNVNSINSAIDELDGLPDNVVEFEGLLERMGVDVSAPNVIDRLRTRHSRLEQDMSGRKRPQIYTSVRDIFLILRDWSSLLFSLLFNVLGAPLALIGLFLAESTTLFDSLQHFFKFNSDINMLISLILMATFYIVEWNYCNAVYLHGDAVGKSKEVISGKSHRWYDGIYNVITDWFSPAKTQVEKLRRMRNRLLVIIILCTSLGRIYSVFDDSKESWYNALVNIFNSDFPTMSQLVITVSLSSALLIGTHFVIESIQATYVRAVGKEEVSFLDESALLREKEKITMQMYRHIYYQALKKQQQSKKKVQPILPEESPMTSLAIES